MNLTLKPDVITWNQIDYIFIEKTGHFMQTAPACWQELHKHMAEIKKSNTVIGHTSLYKVQPEMIYRAGVFLKEEPKNLPDGMKYEKFHGRKYSRFVLKGSYSQLPDACGAVFSEVEKLNLNLRDDWFLENYVNDPQTTPEDQLITEILLPTA